MRTALPILVALGLTMWASPLQSAGFDCGKAYKSYSDKISRNKNPEISPQQLATLNRKALRVYDACQTNDLENAKELFERLERWSE